MPSLDEIIESEKVKKKSRSEKSKPLEFSCRKPVPVPRPARAGLVKRAEEAPGDPRFRRDVAGEFDQGKFGRAYEFLNEVRESEKKQIQRTLADRNTTEEEKEGLSRQLTRMASQDALRERRQAEREVRKELKGDGKYIAPKSKIKAILAERRDDELRKSGKLDKAIAKREKRFASESKKSLPRTRRVVEYPN
jgi:ribosomal RNA-processing protein 36